MGGRVQSELALTKYFVISGEPYNITIQAVDQGKPPRSATAVINLTLRPLPASDLPRELPRSTIERVKKKNALIINHYENPANKYANDLGTKDFESKIRQEDPTESDVISVTQSAVEQQKGSSGPPHLLPVGQMFKKEVYNLELYENVKTPLVILDLGKEVVGVGDGERSLPIHYRIVGSNYGLFSVEEEGGQLYLTQSPDREQREKYILRVKVSSRHGHNVWVLIREQIQVKKN